MELSDQKIIHAMPDKVFAALNDPEVLRACIPGCESLEKSSDTEMKAVVTLKIGPVKASFKGKVTLSKLKPPHSFTISGQGSGTTAGFARGYADILLKPHDDGTQLSYEVKAQVGGKIAQLGSRLIDGTAKKLAGDFFGKFADNFAPPQEGKIDFEKEPDEQVLSKSGSEKRRFSRLQLAAAEVIGLVALAIAVFYFVV